MPPSPEPVPSSEEQSPPNPLFPSSKAPLPRPGIVVQLDPRYAHLPAVERPLSKVPSKPLEFRPLISYLISMARDRNVSQAELRRKTGLHSTVFKQTRTHSTGTSSITIGLILLVLEQISPLTEQEKNNLIMLFKETSREFYNPNRRATDPAFRLKRPRPTPN